jgi:hypothetical protein
VLKYPEPAFQSTKDIRDMMMTKLWQKHRIDDIHNGSCGPEIQRCLHDIIRDLGQLNEMDMRDQITIRMTKTLHQDQPPHYSVQDTVLFCRISLLLRALVCKSATADHLCEELYGLQCITDYCRIKLQNGLLSAANARPCYLTHLISSLD